MPVVGGIDLTGGTIAAFGTLLVIGLQIYDVFFVTFDQEVTLVWPSRWNLVKALFFLNRYLPFVDTFLSLHHSDESLDRKKHCPRLVVVGICISEVILMIRTSAIWGRRRAIHYVLLFLGAGTLIPSIVMAQLEVMSLDCVHGGCIKSRPSSRIVFVAYLLLVVMCETTIAILTLVQAWRHYRSNQVKSPLISQLYKDGLLYFVYLQVFLIFNIIIAVAGPPDIGTLLAIPQRVLHSVLCTRVLLHIRSHSRSYHEEITTTQVAMAFAELGLPTVTQNSDSGMAANSSKDTDVGMSLTFSNLVAVLILPKLGACRDIRSHLGSKEIKLQREARVYEYC
ncbi:hypothetical protein ACEPAF_4356 [Sanghuangporus sanghuang]